MPRTVWYNVVDIEFHGIHIFQFLSSVYNFHICIESSFLKQQQLTEFTKDSVRE